MICEKTDLLRLEPKEVAEVLWVPLAFFFPPSHSSVSPAPCRFKIKPLVYSKLKYLSPLAKITFPSILLPRSVVPEKFDGNQEIEASENTLVDGGEEYILWGITLSLTNQLIQLVTGFPMSSSPRSFMVRLSPISFCLVFTLLCWITGCFLF
eukprot:TRINITY_DN298_c0_g1_i1.p1 TRINITY_DN298_c0_g1~~TRINITY_DN298_c0_g1_i1.p1  ORF type:complete len:152 (+),score=8.40 TRINITY_DN298_c0_g1_i1:397-852(+)